MSKGINELVVEQSKRILQAVKSRKSASYASTMYGRFDYYIQWCENNDDIKQKTITQIRDLQKQIENKFELIDELIQEGFEITEQTFKNFNPITKEVEK